MPGLPDSIVDLVAARALSLVDAHADADDAALELSMLSAGDAVPLRLACARWTSSRRPAPDERVAHAIALLRAAERTRS